MNENEHIREMATCKRCIHKKICVIQVFPGIFENTEWAKKHCDYFKEAVQCKDCINKRQQRNVIYCNRHGGEMFDDDYCSYGERKEQNNDE